MYENNLDLSGKVALVTGSTRGVGKAIAGQLSSQGAIVITNSKEGRSTIYTEDDERLDYYACDVSKHEAVKRMFKEIYQKYGRLDILVNSAGGAVKEAIIGATEATMDSLYEQNLKTTLIATKCALKYMLKQRSGNIINIGSIAGLDGMGMQAHYAAFKSALSGYTKSLVMEYGGRGIRVNMVAPGAMEGNPLYTKEEEETILKNIPLRRLGKAEDIANVIGFLASDMSSYINGQIIRVDGGIRI